MGQDFVNFRKGNGIMRISTGIGVWMLLAAAAACLCGRQAQAADYQWPEVFTSQLWVADISDTTATLVDRAWFDDVLDRDTTETINVRWIFDEEIYVNGGAYWNSGAESLLWNVANGWFALSDDLNVGGIARATAVHTDLLTTLTDTEIDVGAPLFPTITDTYDLGSTLYKWNDGIFSGDLRANNLQYMINNGGLYWDDLSVYLIYDSVGGFFDLSDPPSSNNGYYIDDGTSQVIDGSGNFDGTSLTVTGNIVFGEIPTELSLDGPNMLVQMDADENGSYESLAMALTSGGALTAYGQIKSQNATPALILTDSTASADDYQILVDGNNFSIKHDADDNGDFESSRMVIDSSGNVGFGRAPSYRGDFYTASGGTALSVRTGTSSDVDLYLGTDDTTWAFTLQDTDELEIGLNGNVVMSFSESAASQSAWIGPDGNVGVGAASDGTRLYVQDAAADYVASFFNDGANANRKGLKVQVGDDSGTEAYVLDAYDGDGGAEGGLEIDTGTLQLYQISDRILKRFERETDKDGLTIVRDSPVKDFEYVDLPGHTVTGFVAQDLQAVYPEMVGSITNTLVNDDGTTETTTTLTVRPLRMIPIHTRAIQQMDARVTALEAENAELRGRLAALEAAVF